MFPVFSNFSFFFVFDLFYLVFLSPRSPLFFANAGASGPFFLFLPRFLEFLSDLQQSFPLGVSPVFRTPPDAHANPTSFELFSDFPLKPSLSPFSEQYVETSEPSGFLLPREPISFGEDFFSASRLFLRSKYTLYEPSPLDSSPGVSSAKEVFFFRVPLALFFFAFPFLVCFFGPSVALAPSSQSISGRRRNAAAQRLPLLAFSFS